jgi:Ca2+-binding RTX toxin-like protein
MATVKLLRQASMDQIGSGSDSFNSGASSSIGVAILYNVNHMNVAAYVYGYRPAGINSGSCDLIMVTCEGADYAPSFEIIAPTTRVTMNSPNSIVESALAGDDNIMGSKFGDVIEGFDGKDRIHGNDGNDRIYGGAGADQFYFDSKLNATSNVDSIVDFAKGEKLVLQNTGPGLFNTLTKTGALSGAFFKANASGNATDANDHIVYNTTSGELFYDKNGNAAGGFTEFAVLENHLKLSSLDFLVI